MATRAFSDHHRVTARALARVLLQIENPGVESELSLRFVLLPNPELARFIVSAVLLRIRMAAGPDLPKLNSSCTTVVIAREG